MYTEEPQLDSLFAVEYAVIYTVRNYDMFYWRIYIVKNIV